MVKKNRSSLLLDEIDVNFPSPNLPNKIFLSIPPSKPIRPIVIGLLKPSITANSISRRLLESLVDFQSSGIVINNYRINEGRVTIDFLTVKDRDNALHKLKSISASPFEKLYAPIESFPAILDLYNIQDIHTFPSNSDPIDIKIQKEKSIIEKIEMENPHLAGHIVALRILKTGTSENCNSVLARIAFKSFKIRDTLVSEAKLSFQNLSHRVYKAKAIKEVKQCLGCQKHGHLCRFCISKKIKCGICAEPHETESCTAFIKSCANCKGPHKADDANCPHKLKALSEYNIKYYPEWLTFSLPHSIAIK